MKKAVLIILLCVEWLFGTIILKTLFKPSFIYALLMIGINALLLWKCCIPICQRIFHKKIDNKAFMQNGILILNAVELLLLYVFSVILYYAI